MKKFIFIALLFLSKFAFASHIVGGEFSYKCLGNNTYQFTFNLYRDCRDPNQGGGQPNALADDDPAYFSIYNGNNFYGFDSVYSSSTTIIPKNFSNECLNNPPNTCISRLQFTVNYQLPPSNNPYTILCQRCCRNGSVTNVINPGNTGASYFCVIPPLPIVCNNSAVFKNYPPQIICVNNPFVYDHSATDADGDSLSYEFCDAFTGGDPNDPKPVLIGGQLPFIGTINYVTPFSGGSPMGGNPVLSIDPVSGIITGTPNLQGQFVVNVCCHEWRNGVKINTEKREFQFVVTNCSKAVVADIPQYSVEPNTYVVSCKTKTVFFKNNSSGGFRYHWDFGVNNILTDTSNIFEPTYTYADTGTYLVTLVVNEGSTCPDSITRIVKVYPDYKADFSYAGTLCPNQPISFIDQSVATFNPINYWNWNFNDGNTSSDQNPMHNFQNVGRTFLVTLISGNKYGCRDTATQQLTIPRVNVFAGNDTVIIRNTSIQYNGTGAQTYEWIPSTFLDNQFVYNPIGVYADTGVYTYVLKGTTANNCIGYDTINVTVALGPYLSVPNAFSPNGDGNNDIFKILSAGYKRLNYYKIYDRWGKQVFFSANFRKGWDGTINGKECEMGVYFWMISATDLDDKEKVLRGDVTLLR